MSERNHNDDDSNEECHSEISKRDEKILITILYPMTKMKRITVIPIVYRVLPPLLRSFSRLAIRFFPKKNEKEKKGR